MIQSPTYIHFRTQWHLLGPDSPGLRIERDKFREFWQELNQDPLTKDYDDFSYRPERCELAKVREQLPDRGVPFSKIVFANDGLTVVEEWAEISAKEFGKKFTAILKAWFQHFPETLAAIQKCWVRSLVQPMNHGDSREFIGNHVLGLGEDLKQNFSEMPFRVGFMVGCVRKTGNGDLVIETKVNSWRDNSQVWVEVAGTLALPRPINTTNPDDGQLAFTKCADFLDREVMGLLRVYDSREGKEDGGENS
jgi:hypothetical protein